MSRSVAPLSKPTGFADATGEVRGAPLSGLTGATTDSYGTDRSVHNLLQESQARMASSKKTESRTRGRPSSRETMLDAAEAVVLKQGVAALTLDAVAREAGASKGGVMYNFPSKEALLTALVERIIEGNAKGVAAAAEKMADSPTRHLKAYVTNSVDDLQGDDRVSGTLLATVANNPKLVARMRDFIHARFLATSKNLDFERAGVVHLATEGLWFMELLQISPFNPRQRARLAKRLLKMADECGDA